MKYDFPEFFVVDASSSKVIRMPTWHRMSIFGNVDIGDLESSQAPAHLGG
jgi:hypothetical protein